MLDMSKLTVVIADDSEVMCASVRQLLDEEFDVVGEVSDGFRAFLSRGT